MRKLLLFFGLVVLIGAAVPVKAETTGTSMEVLRAWDGQFTFTKIDGQTFWDVPVLRKEAQNVLGSDIFRALFSRLANEVTTPVRLEGDVLSTFVCKSHECPRESATLFINIKTQKFYVCWHVPSERYDMWYQTGADPIAVGEGGCAAERPMDLYKTYVKE